MTTSGPLADISVLLLGGVGPAPMAATLLGDMGARVVRVDQPGTVERVPGTPWRFDLLSRNQESVFLDLKQPADVEAAQKLAARSDIVIEGFRPGVMERLGLGPDELLHRNRLLVYGRVTGWGQDGPLAGVAGHDINYIALTGALHAIGTDTQPVAPLNLLGDFAGGALYLAMGVLSALLEARRSGQGQVVDAAMVDGVAGLLTSMYGLRAAGIVRDARCSNLLDGGSFFYGVYECADGRWLSVGPIEPKFYEQFMMAIDMPELVDRGALDTDDARTRLAAKLRERTRDDWAGLLGHLDCCVAPVLSLDEAPLHPHNQERSTFITVDGITQPAPAPRFSRTPTTVRHGPREPGSLPLEAALAGQRPIGRDLEDEATPEGSGVPPGVSP